MSFGFNIPDAPWIGNPDYGQEDYEEDYSDQEDYEYEWHRDEERMEEN